MTCFGAIWSFDMGQENFEFIKIAELDTWQRMRLAEIRVAEERQRRLEQDKITERLEILLKIKVCDYLPMVDYKHGFLSKLSCKERDFTTSEGTSGLFHNQLQHCSQYHSCCV